jgi:hypothetical protein
MRFSTLALLRIFAVVVVVVLGVWAIVAALTSCTLVYIEGDSNSVSDTGGHGGGVTLPPRQQPTLSERLNGLKQSQ